MSGFLDRLQELRPVLSAKYNDMEKNLTGTPEEKQRQIQAAIRAEVEKIANETLGDKGHALVSEMMKEVH